MNPSKRLIGRKPPHITAKVDLQSKVATLVAHYAHSTGNIIILDVISNLVSYHSYHATSHHTIYHIVCICIFLSPPFKRTIIMLILYIPHFILHFTLHTPRSTHQARSEVTKRADKSGAVCPTNDCGSEYGQPRHSHGMHKAAERKCQCQYGLDLTCDMASSSFRFWRIYKLYAYTYR
jgi:hypothetical protein